MSIGIYKITNTINQKAYIGQSIHIEDRWYQHKQESKNPRQKPYNYSIHQAFRKYGIEHFTFEIVEECPIEELNEREKYWVAYYNTYKKGYNETEGGEAGPSLPGELNPNAKITNDDVINIRQAVLQDMSQQDFYNLYYKNKLSYHQFCRIWRGESWLEIMPEAIEYVKSQEYLTKVRQRAGQSRLTEQQHQYHQDIHQRKIAGETRKEVYQTYQHIYSQGGFDKIWYQIKENTGPKQRAVIKLNKNTLEYLEEYESAAEAGRQNNCDSSSIIKVCKGKKNSCKGFKWKYKDENIL